MRAQAAASALRRCARRPVSEVNNAIAAISQIHSTEWGARLEN
jgi:hypothetical protein